MGRARRAAGARALARTAAKTRGRRLGRTPLPLLVPLLLAALGLAGPAHAAQPRPCGLPALFPLAPPSAPPVWSPTAREKDSRNPYSVPNVLETDDFAIRWGPDVQDGAQIDALAEALQDGWADQVGVMGFPAPPTTDATRMNVYLGDTGGNTPTAAGAGGYFTPDEDGYPVLVIGPDAVVDPAWGRVVALHELHHALQWGLGTYGYGEGDPGAWMWEATASWVPSFTDPQETTHGVFLWGFALAPEAPLDAFDYPETGALTEYHQYGAFIFMTFLAEEAADWTIVRDAWTDPPGGTTDPIAAFRALLNTRGLVFDDVFRDFAAHNVFWDYAQGATWGSYVDWGMQLYPGSDWASLRIAEADGLWRDPSDARRPRALGSNVVVLPEGEALRVELEPEFTGSEGTECGWMATLVTEDEDGIAYEVDPNASVSTTFLVPADARAALSLVPVVDERTADERFSYRVRVVAEDPGDDDDATADDDDTTADDDDGGGGWGGDGCSDGCAGCHAAGGEPATAALLALYGALVPLRRRRSSASARKAPSGNSAA